MTRTDRIKSYRRDRDTFCLHLTETIGTITRSEYDDLIDAVEDWDSEAFGHQLNRLMDWLLDERAA